MPAYLIVEHTITDPEKFQDYSRQVRPQITEYGGRLLTKGGSHRVLETKHWLPNRVAIFGFGTPAASLQGGSKQKSPREGWLHIKQHAEVQFAYVVEAYRLVL